MVASAVAAAISFLAVLASLRRLLIVSVLGPDQPELLEPAVKARDPASVGRALDALFPEGWSPSLAEALLGVGSREAAVAELNEQLGDVDRDLRRGDDVPRGAARIALFTGVFAGIVEVSRAVGQEAANYSSAVSALGAGLVGALISAELGRRARDRVGDTRGEWDRVATVFARLLGTEDLTEGRPRDGQAGQDRARRRRH